ncbi:ATP-binding protein [Actinokineospora fastidiosa]|uniref:Uncharacterized protein n=1 Tax=Actinokineospora fastidiosa TaxID=1816 RepID=A0A918GRF4_9PSEU|nr:ATP-binding protein [Actinokineospora fastidiosa]GGS56647.1 hypothetical protein GCM10010171_59560 [Actinokineospora fastidiosa]
MSQQPQVRNEFSGTVVGTVVQGRDVTIALPDAQPEAVAGLPAQPLFVGREAELARVAEVLDPAAGPGAGAVVAGLPGAGKTALAVRAALDAVAAGWFPGGVLMVDLRGYDQRVSPAAALAGLLGALGVSRHHIPDGEADRSRLWRSLLADRHAAGQRMLVVLDNAGSGDQVHPLLPGEGAHRVLITSRHSLTDVDAARLVEIGELSAAQAVALLREHLAACHAHDGRVHAHPEAARRLVRLCGGLPLALRVAAALLAEDPGQPVSELADALEDERERLSELNHDGSLDVRAAFDLSYRHLPDPAARLFRLLALNPGEEVRTATAAALADHTVAQTRRVLAHLRRAHLVQAGSSRGRWRMHDLLRLYAAEQVDGDAEREPALDRLVAHYVSVAEAALSHFDTRRASHWEPIFGDGYGLIDKLEAEYGNLIGALYLAKDTGRSPHAIAAALHELDRATHPAYWEPLGFD